jgi:probable HAF family extracellular repeat protein
MKKRRFIILLICAVLLLVVILISIFKPRNQGLYNVTFLPSLEGAFTLPLAINDRGQIAGFLEFSDGTHHLFLWDQLSGIRDLGPVSGSISLNNAGQIAATFQDPNNNQRAFIWDPNTGRTILPTPGGDYSFIYEINNRGQAVGDAKTSTGVRHAFIWDKVNGICDLTPTSTEDTFAWSINDAGQVIIAQGTNVLVNISGNKIVTSVSIPLIDMCKINNNGYVVGMARNRTDQKKYDVAIWQSGSNQRRLIKSNEGFSSYAYYINDINQVIITEVRFSTNLFGTKTTVSKIKNFLFDPKLGLISLDGYTHVKRNEVFVLTDINNKGMIIGGVQSIKDSRSRGVLLEPIPEQWNSRINPVK